MWHLPGLGWAQQPAAFGGLTAAALLLRDETDGIAFDFTDDSAQVKDTTVTNNTWPVVPPAAGMTYRAQDWFKRRSFASYTAPSPKVVRQQDGTYKPAPHNLVPMSERFQSAAWTIIGASVVDNSVVAYDGTTTAALFTSDSGNSAHNLRNTTALAPAASHPFTFAVDVKAGTSNFVALNVRGATNHWYAAVFDLSDGLTTSSQTAAGATSGTVLASSKENLGNGWWRIKLTGAHTQTVNSYYIMFASAASGNSFSTDGLLSYLGTGLTLSIGRAQQNHGYTALAYQMTEDHNLVIRSQEQATNWTATDITVASNSADTAGPDGGNTPERHTEGTAGTALLRSTAFTVPASSVVTASVWLKRHASTGPQWVRLMLSDGSDTNGANAWFDLTNGVAGASAAIGAGTNVASSMTFWGNGWYRCVVTAMCSTSTSLTMAFASADANSSSTRVNSAVYYGWGAQARLGTTAGKYVVTTTAAVYSNYFALPYEWDANGVAQGVLVEEARTNLDFYNRDLTQTASSGWKAVNVTAALTATGVDGAANSASTITATAANAGIGNMIIGNAAGANAVSVFVKRRTGTGTVTLFGGVNSVTGSNLVTNGAFASADLTGWTDESTGTGTASGATSAAALVGTDGSNRGAISQALTLTAGKFYRLTFDGTVASGAIDLRLGTVTALDSSHRLPAMSVSAGANTIFFVAPVTSVYLRFNTATAGGNGTVDNIAVEELTGTDITSSINASTWTRITNTPYTVAGTFRGACTGFMLATNGDAIDVDFVQREVGAFHTSPIYTAGAAVTRAADQIRYATALHPYSQSTQTAFVRATAYNATATLNGSVAPCALTINDDTANEFIIATQRVQTTNQARIYITDGGSIQLGAGGLGTPAISNGATFRCATSWEANDARITLDGAAADQDTSCTMPTVHTVFVGQFRANTGIWGGHIRQMMLLPRSSTTGQLQGYGA